MIYEVDRFMKTDGQKPIGIKTQAAAIEERIRDWLETPEGSRVDRPWFGSPLSRFKHDPMADVINQAKTTIAVKLMQDLQIPVDGIQLDEAAIDMLLITLVISGKILIQITTKV